MQGGVGLVDIRREPPGLVELVQDLLLDGVSALLPAAGGRLGQHALDLLLQELPCACSLACWTSMRDSDSGVARVVVEDLLQRGARRDGGTSAMGMATTLLASRGFWDLLAHGLRRWATTSGGSWLSTCPST